MLIIPREKIEQAKSKLGDKNAELMAQMLNLEDYDSKNMKACCCFHAEDTPSLIYNSKNYTFHCFGCQKTIDVIDVLIMTGMTYAQAVQKLFELANIKYAFGEIGVKTEHKYIYPKEVVCGNKEKTIEYLRRRRISPRTIEHADVREDENGNMVFNFYDANDVLCLVKYRPARKINKEKKEPKCWCQKNADTMPLLFNMNRVNVNTPLLITEGEIDCLSAIEAGYANAVSVPLGAGNYQWIEHNLAWLEQFESVIICADNDEAGTKLQKEAAYRIGSWKTKFVEIPCSVTKENGEEVSVKDLNECLFYKGRDFVLDLILNAKDTPITGVVDYTKIKASGIEQLDGIRTGIKDLDKKIMKLPLGSTTIVSGITGSGKSSFLSQLICQALYQDANAFMYSGELDNSTSKDWVDFIHSGQRNLKKYTNEDGAEYYKISNEAQEGINKYYESRLWIYSDECDHKATSILKKIEDCVRKYGIKLAIIDNLTSINLENNDFNKLSKQSEFISNLIQFAKVYNIAVVLVVHPHKIEAMRRLSLMDIQGISAVIDLAHRVFSLYRVQEKDKQGELNKNGKGFKTEPVKYDVICDILKDRYRPSGGQSVGLYYDVPSRRFFTNEEDLDLRYKWDKNTYTGELPFPPKQLTEENEVYGSIKDGEN